MLFDKLITVLPLSQIDPDPGTLTERVAHATLGSYQALWDPRLLSRSASLPTWAAPSNPPLGGPAQLILVPEPTRRLLAAAWEEQARAAGARVIMGEETRARFLARLQEELPELAGQLVAEITHDFFALGLARLWLDMVTAYMKHANTLDETRFEKEVLAAAAATVVADQPTCDNHLRAAFQLLREARDQLYPADVHLLDLCLVDPRAGIDRLHAQLECGQPINVFLSGRTAEELKRREPETAEHLKTLLEEARADIVGGEFDEIASTLLPLESHLWQFARGDRSYRDVFGRTPHIFGRRRFGLARHVLQLLNRHDFHHTTHFSFDDGVVPTRSDAKVRWEAPDSTTVESLARIPFAADSALEFLRLPSRLARSMSGDFVATLAMVHWPMPDVPWYRELFRIARYCDVFARFSTLSNYFQTTDPPSISSSLSSDDFASPYLTHSHRRGERRPISAYAEHHRRRARFDTLRWLRAVELAVRRRAHDDPHEFDGLETDLETSAASVDERLDDAIPRAARLLAELICPPAAVGQLGWLIVNQLGFDRQVVVRAGTEIAPAARSSDAIGDSQTAQEFGESQVSVAVPAMGFVWIPRGAHAGGPNSTRGAVTVEGQVIRNEFIEVELDDVTGGIRSLRSFAGRSPLLGQQLVLCGIRPTPSTSDTGRDPDGYATAGDVEPIKSEMRASATVVRSAGPEVGEVVVEGDLRAVPGPAWADDPRLAGFRQTYRLGRGQSLLRVDVDIFDLAPRVFDERAEPWQAYLGSRFAWPDPRAVMLRGVGTLSETTSARRPESPYFIELHTARQRTTIVTGGLAFHQRHGERMLDTLFVTATEECRRFEFGVGVDLPNPFHAALDLIAPPVMIPISSANERDAGPTGGRSGWFFHVDACNVVVTSVTSLGSDRPGVRLRLFETAGRYTRARLRCVRNVTEARMTDFRGQRLATLDHEGDTVPLDLAPHEITQIEVEF